MSMWVDTHHSHVAKADRYCFAGRIFWIAYRRLESPLENVLYLGGASVHVGI